MDQKKCKDQLSYKDAKIYEDEEKEPRKPPTKVKYSENIDPDALYYDMTQKGLAIIFSHSQFFNTRYNKRPGTDEDALRLFKCFSRLNFGCKIYEEHTAKQIESIIDSVANLKPEFLSCLIVVVLTHGTNEKLAAYDVDYYRTILWEKLAGKLVGIPKLYFMQACRGGGVDKGVEVADSVEVKENVRFTLPEMADFLQMYSSYEGYFSWTEEKGSWFVQSLCDVLEEKSEEWDLQHMLTYVTKKVAINYTTKTREDHTNETKAIPQTVSTLTKFLKFNIKND